MSKLREQLRPESEREFARRTAVPGEVFPRDKYRPNPQVPYANY
jgi:hypothetical protein